MKKILLLLTLCFGIGLVAEAQYRVTGTVVDQKDGMGLPGATASLTSEETGKQVGNSTDLDGKFSIRVKPGKYKFEVVFLGYAGYVKTIEVKEDMSVGTIKMKPEVKELKEVKVAGTMVRQEQRGDTTVFNAAAFKVNPDATTEDLIKKMPGIQVSGNSVTSGGESVKKVLVDGKEYFGSDPMAALRNISADMVSSIEVFDKQSDQSAFTGFSDGDEERTINITTKMGISKGSFGRLYAGYGSDSRYEMGGNVNIFRGDHRVSLIGMLNNINQQNFSFDDFTGAMSMGGRGMRGMFGAGQGGKNRTGSIGLNYTFDNDDNLSIEMSYFYNNNKNVSNMQSETEYFRIKESDKQRVVESQEESEGLNNNHRASLRLEWAINDKNSLIFTPNISWQGNTRNSYSLDDEYLDLSRSYSIVQTGETETNGISGGARFLWRHKFNKERRTLSLSVGSNIGTNDSDQESGYSKNYEDETENDIVTSQVITNENDNISYNGRLMLTEPIGENMAIQFNYSPSYQISKGDKETYADTVEVEGEPFDSFVFSPALSNVKESKYLRQRAGVGLNIFSGKTFNATLGLDWQHANLKGEQEYPIAYETNQSFTSIMPSLRVQIRKDKSMNLRLDYRTNTSAPSISQLQDVIDVSNPMRYSTGNKDLEQSYSHNFRLFFNKSSVETSRGIFFMGNFSATSNYIASSTYTSLEADSLLDNGIILKKGTQFVKPVNLNGYYSARVHATFSTPVSWLGSNLNFNVGVNMTNTPTLNNGRKGTSKSSSLSGGLTLGNSFSENLDFTLSYNGGYTFRNNTSALASENNNYNHTASADINTYLWTRLVLSTNLTHTMTSGMGDADQNFCMWNASVAYKVFPDRRGEFRLKVNDILNVNSSVSRSITESSINTATTDVLRQYVLLTFTYKLKPSGKAPSSSFPGGMMMGPPPPGMRGR